MYLAIHSLLDSPPVISPPEIQHPIFNTNRIMNKIMQFMQGTLPRYEEHQQEIDTATAVSEKATERKKAQATIIQKPHTPKLTARSLPKSNETPRIASEERRSEAVRSSRPNVTKISESTTTNKRPIAAIASPKPIAASPSKRRESVTYPSRLEKTSAKSTKNVSDTRAQSVRLEKRVTNAITPIRNRLSQSNNARSSSSSPEVLPMAQAKIDLAKPNQQEIRSRVATTQVSTPSPIPIRNQDSQTPNRTQVSHAIQTVEPKQTITAQQKQLILRQLQMKMSGEQRAANLAQEWDDYNSNRDIQAPSPVHIPAVVSQLPVLSRMSVTVDDATQTQSPPLVAQEPVPRINRPPTPTEIRKLPQGVSTPTQTVAIPPRMTGATQTVPPRQAVAQIQTFTVQPREATSYGTQTTAAQQQPSISEHVDTSDLYAVREVSIQTTQNIVTKHIHEAITQTPERRTLVESKQTETENVEATPPKPVQANPPIHRSSSPLEPRVLQPVQEARPLEREKRKEEPQHVIVPTTISSSTNEQDQYKLRDWKPWAKVSVMSMESNMDSSSEPLSSVVSGGRVLSGIYSQGEMLTTSIPRSVLSQAMHEMGASMPTSINETMEYSTPTSIGLNKSSYSSIGMIQEVEEGERPSLFSAAEPAWTTAEQGEVRGGILLDKAARKQRNKQVELARIESHHKYSTEAGQVFEFGKDTLKFLEDKENLNISGPSNAFIDCVASNEYSETSMSFAGPAPAHDHRELLSLLSDISSISTNRSPGQTSLNNDNTLSIPRAYHGRKLREADVY